MEMVFYYKVIIVINVQLIVQNVQDNMMKIV
jgi:hypothetical protein